MNNNFVLIIHHRSDELKKVNPHSSSFPFIHYALLLYVTEFLWVNDVKQWLAFPDVAVRHDLKLLSPDRDSADIAHLAPIQVTCNIPWSNTCCRGKLPSTKPRSVHVSCNIGHRKNLHVYVLYMLTSYCTSHCVKTHSLYFLCFLRFMFQFLKCFIYSMLHF